MFKYNTIMTVAFTVSHNCDDPETLMDTHDGRLEALRAAKERLRYLTSMTHEIPEAFDLEQTYKNHPDLPKTMCRIVNTCNFGKDYPFEHFLDAPPMPSATAKTVAKALNRENGENSPRYWKVVNDGYVLDDQGPA